jgi:hypothetical protein
VYLKIKFRVKWCPYIYFIRTSSFFLSRRVCFHALLCYFLFLGILVHILPYCFRLLFCVRCPGACSLIHFVWYYLFSVVFSVVFLEFLKYLGVRNKLGTNTDTIKNFRTREATHIRTSFPHVNAGQRREAVLCNQVHFIISYWDTWWWQVETCSIFKY